jgi:hypothetical protein
MTPAQRQTKDAIEGKIRARLSREDVYRQLAEMYSALDSLAACVDVDPQDYTEAVNQARAAEHRLNERLEAQDRLDRTAPALLEACKKLCPLTHLETCAGLNFIAGCDEREEACTCGAAQARAAIAQAEPPVQISP